jgi:hypothetical protein
MLRDVHEPVCVHLANRHLPVNVLLSQEGERVLGLLEILPEEMMVATYLENSEARVVTRSDAMNHVVRHESSMCGPPPMSIPRCEGGDPGIPTTSASQLDAGDQLAERDLDHHRASGSSAAAAIAAAPGPPTQRRHVEAS